MCTNRHNTTSFGSGVLEDMTCQQMYDCSVALDSAPLRGPKAAHNELAKAMKSAIASASVVRSSK
eukprot:8864822-Pyramimonas_sp.AAC.1